MKFYNILYLTLLTCIFMVGCKSEKEVEPPKVKCGNFIGGNKTYEFNEATVYFENATADAAIEDDAPEGVTFDKGIVSFTDSTIQIKVDARNEYYNIDSISYYYQVSNKVGKMYVSEFVLNKDGAKFKGWLSSSPDPKNYSKYSFYLEKFFDDYKYYDTYYSFDSFDADKLMKDIKKK